MADLSITASQVQPGTAAPETKTAGEQITPGESVYLNSSDDKYYLADADDTAAKATVRGIALHQAEAGQPLRIARGDGTITLGAGASMTVGEIYVLSGTAGGIAPEGDLASNDYVSILGVATTAAILSLKIHNSGVQVP